MPLHNDDTIPPETHLLRVLQPSWTTDKDGRHRPNSWAFQHANGEASLFLSEPGMLQELQQKFPGKEIASVPAAVIRASGLAIQRKPQDCPPDFNCDPNSHVVVGPSGEIQKNDYERRTKAVARHPAVTIIPPVTPTVPTPPPQP